MTSRNGLHVESLACRRDDRLLFQNLGLQLDPGSMLEVCGRNGSGKTTLLRLICGLRQADEGSIYWQGQKIHDQAENYRSDICYVGHLGGLKEDLSPYDNLLAEARIYNCDTEKVEPALLKLGLRREIDLPCRRLSAGQKQRAALARLLIRSAGLWILDEPCASLDRQAQLDVQNLLEEHALNGGSVIFTTHQPIEFKRVSVEQLWLGQEQPSDV